MDFKGENLKAEAYGSKALLMAWFENGKQNEHSEMGKPAVASLSFSYSAISATLHMKRDENEAMEVNEEC